MDARRPFPPFTYETALEKVQRAEDAWNIRNPERAARWLMGVGDDAA
jgi:nuclear transport factor 2 (NTF2) superfamily protein